MAFCVACGSEIREGVKFCPSCGSSTNAEARSASDNTARGAPPILKYGGIAIGVIAVLAGGYWLLGGANDPGADTDGDGFLSHDEVSAELEQRVALRPGRWTIMAQVVETQRTNIPPRDWSRELEQTERLADRVRSIDTCASWGPLEGLGAGGSNDIMDLLNSTEQSLVALNFGRGATLFEVREDVSIGEGSLIRNHRIEGTVYEESINLKMTRSAESVAYGSNQIQSYNITIAVSGEWSDECA